MRTIKLTHFSNVLCRNKNINIILPDVVTEETKFLLLLHGYCGDENDWINLGNAYYEAMKYNMAIVMPSAENSYYININGGDTFYDYINNEVINEVEKIVNVKPNWYIAGLSMGGYGSLLLGIKNHKFKMIGAFSAPCDIVKRIGVNAHHNFKVLFNNFNYNEFDLYNLINRIDKKVYLYCGKNDDFYDDNLKLYNNLKVLNKDIIFESDERGHTWDLWRDALSKYLKIINSF